MLRLRHLCIVSLAPLVGAILVAPADAAPEPVRNDLGTFDGVKAQWWSVQELKDQFRAGWGFENTASETRSFGYTLDFACPDGSGHRETGSVKLNPGQKKAGQWEGFFAYPCKKTAPSSATIKINGTSTTSCKPFVLTIHRSLASQQCTTGYIAVDGKIVGYTLELPDIGNVSDISSIPAKQYKAKLRTDNGKWRVQLDDEQTKRQAIQIHAGNNLGQIKGCILVGKDVDPRACTVSSSGPMLDEIKKAFHPPDGDVTKCAERDITVVVEGTPPVDPGAGQCRDMTACVKVRQADAGCSRRLVNECNRKVHCTYAIKSDGKPGPSSEATLAAPATDGTKSSTPLCESGELAIHCVDDGDASSCKHL